VSLSLITVATACLVAEDLGCGVITSAENVHVNLGVGLLKVVPHGHLYGRRI
jgi:hypothetical protein